MSEPNAAERTVELRRHAQLSPVQPDDVLVNVSVGPADEAITLWSDPSGREALQGRTTSRGGGSSANVRTQAAVAVRVVTQPPGTAAVVRFDDLRLAHCYVQPMPDGQVLIVGARCWWQSGGPDRNAVIVDHDGSLVAQATLGDGIAHVLTTPSGRIWVGYFDEGVFGNYGWNDPGPEPIGDAGIVRFGADLQPEWRYPSSGGDGPISDCYALNVAGETAWSSYYCDFPIVRIADDTVRSWPGLDAAPVALLADGTRCALFGGYGEDHNQLLVGDLYRGEFTAYRLVLPGGRRLPRQSRVYGRGPELHVFVDTVWYRLHLHDAEFYGRTDSVGT